jgi:hypothetical protein
VGDGQEHCGLPRGLTMEIYGQTFSRIEIRALLEGECLTKVYTISRVGETRQVRSTYSIRYKI